MRARWTGPDRYLPDLGRKVTRGEIVDGVPARDVKQGEYWEPVKAAAKPNAKKAAAAKTRGVADAD